MVEWVSWSCPFPQGRLEGVSPLETSEILNAKSYAERRLADSIFRFWLFFSFRDVTFLCIRMHFFELHTYRQSVATSRQIIGRFALSSNFIGCTRSRASRTLRPRRLIGV